MYSKNVEQLLLHLAPRGALALDFDDPITRACVVIHEGRTRGNEPPASSAP
jgi:NAD/NADP transhydrogenase alpha subunit